MLVAVNRFEGSDVARRRIVAMLYAKHTYMHIMSQRLRADVLVVDYAVPGRRAHQESLGQASDVTRRAERHLIQTLMTLNDMTKMLVY
jgi:hypothetical protein